MIILLVFLSLFSLCLLLWQISNLISVFSGSLYVKTDRAVIVRALKLASLKRGEIFYDLGSGNGDILIEAAKIGAKATGFEISPWLFLISKLRTKEYSNIKIKFQNINNVDLSSADVVFCYLLPELLEKLCPKFERELKPGSRLISIGFPIKISLISAPVSKRDIYKVKNHKVYIYRVRSRTPRSLAAGMNA